MKIEDVCETCGNWTESRYSKAWGRCYERMKETYLTHGCDKHIAKAKTKKIVVNYDEVKEPMHDVKEILRLSIGESEEKYNEIFKFIEHYWD